MWRIWSQLKAQGVLGINARNADFLLPANQRRLYPLVDDKLQTKQLAIRAGIAVPELYHVIQSYGQMDRVLELLKDRREFVIKPAHGSGGEGIIVIVGNRNGKYRLVDGCTITQEELKFHLSSCLSGIYSLGGRQDSVLVEHRVHSDPIFQRVSYHGVPDIRIIVFHGIPTMAMVRLPTRQSHGKANLHQGAIGVGIDLATGKTLLGVCENEIVSEHPDTGYEIADIEIPHWRAIMELGVRSYELTGLQYQGVDIVLDEQQGPLILELNARPGLNIQIANRAGLRLRLNLINAHYHNLHTIEQRIGFARDHFGVSKT